MKVFGFIPMLAATVIASSIPAKADPIETDAWSAVQKINEMAEEARIRCASGHVNSCSEASSVSGISFQLVQDAKRCSSGRFPITCTELRATISKIDGHYHTYLAKVGPAQVAANKARLQCRMLPFGGNCDSGNGVMQTHLSTIPNTAPANSPD